MRPPKRPASISSGNRTVYRQAFIGHVHALLRAGYAALTPTKFTGAEEDDITGELCKHLKHFTEVAPPPASPWMARYSIHDQDPVNDAKREADGSTRRGKCRPRLDIRIVQHKRLPKVSFSLEAKRLYRGDSVADYLDDEGLNAFVQEYYAKDDGACGMLGYVQTGTISTWAKKLRSRLAKEPSAILDENAEPWTETAPEDAGVNVYLSRHQRPPSGRSIDGHHLLLGFV